MPKGKIKSYDVAISDPEGDYVLTVGAEDADDAKRMAREHVEAREMSEDATGLKVGKASES